MRVILLGAPGAGKGTVAKLLNAHDGSVQISTGDILRSAVAAGTALGKEAKGYMDRGELVPDSLIMGIMEQRLQEADAAKGFLLDGFPRTIPQAEALGKLLKKLGIKLDLVVSLEVPREVILDRLTTRRTCSNGKCQEIYNIKSKPAGPGDTCLKCGSPVVQRADETVEAITKRLDTYEKMTAPLIDYYRQSGVFFSVPNLVSKEAFDGIVRKLGK
ncbi:MAG TPA: adenylate kinase [bacterium]